MTENEAIKELEDYVAENDEITISIEAVTLSRKALEEIQQYRAIGTVEEFKTLQEKNTKKRFNIFESHGMRQFVCGCCDRPILTTDNYCSFCGQKLDW